MLYVGQSGRSFKVHMNKHSCTYRLEDRRSNYAAHLFDTNVSNQGLLLNALEALIINENKFWNILLNDQLDINRSPLLNLKL